MRAVPVILIFDVGKTNKKILLFDDQYRVASEESIHLDETIDEDGFPGEDVHKLTAWIKTSLDKILHDQRFDVRAVNFSGYGASFVCVNELLDPVLPLYNYLKPYPENLLNDFYSRYGGKDDFSMTTASPVLGSLNSGMQLFRIKAERPADFQLVKFALHLPQYLSAIVTGQAFSEITSIGCHTNLWDFTKQKYHRWVEAELIHTKLPPITESNRRIPITHGEKTFVAGAGLHDSSSALIPYLINFREPFILLSTGTWCISLNPFNHTPLSSHDLENDCLCYLTYEGKPVKASRLFAGHDHEEQVKRISVHFQLPVEYFSSLKFDPVKMNESTRQISKLKDSEHADTIRSCGFATRDLSEFTYADDAYRELITDLVTMQFYSTRIVQSGTDVKRIFVDGGFSKNSIYMHLLAAAFPDVEVYAASVAQASALGAALALHEYWNNKPLPADLIELKLYADPTKTRH